MSEAVEEDNTNYFWIITDDGLGMFEASTPQEVISFLKEIRPNCKWLKYYQVDKSHSRLFPLVDDSEWTKVDLVEITEVKE
jgi:hypothetical protein